MRVRPIWRLPLQGKSPISFRISIGPSLGTLRGGTRTIDDLNDLHYYVDRRLLTEALFRAVDQDRVIHEIIEFSTALVPQRVIDIRPILGH